MAYIAYHYCIHCSHTKEGPTLKPDAKEALVNVLREAILGGRLRPGQHLQEATVAASLGVSRTPVREAFMTLRQMDLLVPRDSGRGFEVKSFSPEQVRDTFFVRTTLEQAAIRLLAPRVTGDGIAELRSYLSWEHAMLSQGEYRKIKEEGWKFHDMLLELTGNQPLRKAVRAILDQVRIVIALGPPTSERMWDSHADHSAIVEALADHDAVRASSVIERHLMGAQNALLADPTSLRRTSDDISLALQASWDHVAAGGTTRS